MHTAIIMVIIFCYFVLELAAILTFLADTQSYVLNFHGRVTQASVKNFQIVHDNDGRLMR